MVSSSSVSKGKIESFMDLAVWRKGRNLVVKICRLTRTFPKEEQYSLGDQMRRATVPVMSNTADKEKVRFH